MFSFEKARTKAYSSDLQWRMVYQRCIQELPYATIASNLNVHPSTVYRTVKLFEETGTVCSIQGYHETTCKKLTINDEFAILEAVLDNPSIYLTEIQQLLFQTTGTTVTTATICKYLHQAGFSKSYNHSMEGIPTVL